MKPVVVEMVSFDMEQKIEISRLALLSARTDLIAEAERELVRRLGHEAQKVLRPIAEQVREIERNLGPMFSAQQGDWLGYVLARLRTTAWPEGQPIRVAVYSMRAAMPADVRVEPRALSWIQQWPTSSELLLRSMMS